MIIIGNKQIMIFVFYYFATEKEKKLRSYLDQRKVFVDIRMDDNNVRGVKLLNKNGPVIFSVLHRFCVAQINIRQGGDKFHSSVMLTAAL
jgi:hypothetical protein